MNNSDDFTTWRECLALAMIRNNDAGPVVAFAPNEEYFDVRFDAGYGGSNGPDVLAWTEGFVYFPVVYDGAEWLGSAPRSPRAEGQHHEGGE